MSVIKNYIDKYEFLCDQLKKGKALFIATDSVNGIIALNREVIYKIKKRDAKKKSYCL